jgi:DNA-binding NtrC family response regulator
LVQEAGPVLEVFREALAGVGFEIESAQTAVDAVDLLATRHYAVIITDCALPDLPPLDWLAAVRGEAPGTPLVVYSDPIVVADFQDHAPGFGAVAVLQRPLTPAQLVAAVHRALGARAVGEGSR